MLTIVLIVLLVLVFGGYRAGGQQIGHSVLGLVLLILLILLLTGNLR